jgi:hypothetical protein
MNIKSLSMIVGTFLAFQTVSFAQLESKGATKTVHTSAPKQLQKQLPKKSLLLAQLLHLRNL